MNILFYGSHYWDRGPWFRKQHFAKNLAKRGHRVFYIENSVSVLKLRNHHKNKLWKTRFTKVDDNITVITPSAFYPFPHNYFLRHLYNVKLTKDILRYFKKNNITEYVFWFNIINYMSVLNRLKPKKIVFDFSDDVPLFYKLANKERRYRTYMKWLKIAYKNADIASVTAVKIREKYQHLTDRNILVIPNGHNFSHFQETDKVPDDIKNIPKPVVGFLGTLFRFTDEDLVEFLISSRPDYSFVFVGRNESSFPVERITKYPNVYVLGEKKKDEVGSYINAFDICLNPFKIHEVNDSVSPLKVFEYLAFRKHVVSSYMYSLQKEKISKHIHFGKTYEDILENLDRIIRSGNFVNDIPEKELLEYHWDNLFLKMIKEIEKEYNFKF